MRENMYQFKSVLLDSFNTVKPDHLLIVQFYVSVAIKYVNVHFFRPWGPVAHGSRGPASNPAQGNCVVFLGKALYSLSASLHPGL